MANQDNHQSARAFAGAFAQSLAESLTKTAGLPWQLKVLDGPDLTPQQGGTIHFRLTVEGGLRGAFFVEFCELQVKELVSRLSGAAAAVDEEPGRALEALIFAAGANLAASLSAEHGPFTCKVDRVSELGFGGMLHIPLAAFEGEQSAISVGLYFDGQLLSSLAAQSPGQDAVGAQKPSLDLLNLDLVMDVELNVSLRFGQRQLPLREVLELSSGSVIELDRQVDDPVELLLDGKVIARGEAVIVDGNYGLRVTEIPMPMASHFVR
jgi:flagellar motor switch protein FliN/FliY